MGIYRISRNLEASLIDYIKQELTNGSWTDIRVEKSFAEVDRDDQSVVCVRLSDTIHNKAEIGTDSTIRQPLILIDIFAKNDGLRLDLKDFLVEKLKKGGTFYNYVITNGLVSNKTANGRIRVLKLTDTIVDLGIDKDALAIKDRYRHLITLSVSLGKVEL